MRSWLRGKRGGLIAFAVIAALVAGGLGWITRAALRLEDEHLAARAQADLHARLQLALSLLDSRVRPVLAREDSRPYNHYRALYATSQALSNTGQAFRPGTVFEPSPLLNAELPDWMLLHFQADAEGGWRSPQVPSPADRQRLEKAGVPISLANVTTARGQLLAELPHRLPAATLLASALQHGAEPTLHDTTTLADNPSVVENYANPYRQALNNMNSAAPQAQAPDPVFLKRALQQNQASQEARAPSQRDSAEVAYENISPAADDLALAKGKGAKPGEQVEVVLSPMVPLWLTTPDGREQLLLARVVRLARHQVCQGIVLDWPRLQTLLTAEISDLFPNARLLPVRDDTPDDPERPLRIMTALPVELDPGTATAAVAAPGWTPLRVGLCLGWAAALVALLAAGLGGWSLLDLSERRIRFVSAVTHELRTPLTTLRLYLDMLTGGLVTGERQRDEYLHTLHAETERLNRLVGNVLDFSRLENQRPRLVKTSAALTDILGQVRAAWEGRCRDAGKELVIENTLAETTRLTTDVGLVQQILGNLIDNACKYSRSAADPHVWLRARHEGGTRLVLEVEDRGPGVAARERRAIFHPFRRGRDVDATAGGVGLGLALAQRWARLLGGRLTLHGGRHAGACFRLELPSPG